MCLWTGGWVNDWPWFSCPPLLCLCGFGCLMAGVRYLTGDIIRYSCLPGFTLVGNEILTCRLGERLQMDGPPPVCQGELVWVCVYVIVFLCVFIRVCWCQGLVMCAHCVFWFSLACCSQMHPPLTLHSNHIEWFLSPWSLQIWLLDWLA